MSINADNKNHDAGTGKNKKKLKDAQPDRKRGQRLTAEDAGKIKYLSKTTDWLQHQIAAYLNMNQGRVSEVLTGKRFYDVAPIPC